MVSTAYRSPGTLMAWSLYRPRNDRKTLIKTFLPQLSTERRPLPALPLSLSTKRQAPPLSPSGSDFQIGQRVQVDDATTQTSQTGHIRQLSDVPLSWIGVQFDRGVSSDKGTGNVTRIGLTSNRFLVTTLSSLPDDSEDAASVTVTVGQLPRLFPQDIVVRYQLQPPWMHWSPTLQVVLTADCSRIRLMRVYASLTNRMDEALSQVSKVHLHAYQTSRRPRDQRQRASKESSDQPTLLARYSVRLEEAIPARSTILTSLFYQRNCPARCWYTCDIDPSAAPTGSPLTTVVSPVIQSVSMFFSHPFDGAWRWSLARFGRCPTVLKGLILRVTSNMTTYLLSDASANVPFWGGGGCWLGSLRETAERRGSRKKKNWSLCAAIRLT
jgi:hypothetical protein